MTSTLPEATFNNLPYDEQPYNDALNAEALTLQISVAEDFELSHADPISYEDDPDLDANGNHQGDHAAYRQVWAGDDKGITYLYDRHADRLQRVIGSSFSDLDANDIVQQVFLNLTRRRIQPELRQSTAFPLLRRIAVNAAIDDTRSRDRRAILTDDDRALETALPATSSAESTVVSALQAAELAEILEQLPERQKDALLALAEGLTYVEIQQQLGYASLSNVSSDIHRGRAKVQELATAAGYDMPAVR